MIDEIQAASTMNQKPDLLTFFVQFSIGLFRFFFFFLLVPKSHDHTHICHAVEKKIWRPD